MSGVIKNIRRTEVKPMSHVPEWKRLDREPVLQDNTDDFSFISNHKKGVKVSQPANKTNVPNVGSGNWNQDPDVDPRVTEVFFDAPLPPKRVEQVASESKRVAERSSDDGIQPGQHAVMYNGEILAVSFDVAEMEQYIEEMIQRDIPVEEIILLKRLKLKVGVLAE